MLDPYNYSPSTFNTYHFTTTAGITYSIAIADYASLFGLQTGIVFLTVYPFGDPAPKKDIRIGDTLTQFILDHFQTKPNDIMLYVCSDDDGQEKARIRLFGMLVRKHKKDNIEMCVRTIEDSDHHFLYRTDNETAKLFFASLDEYLAK